MKSNNYLSILAFSAFLAGLSAAFATPNLGPFYDRFPLTLTTGERTEAFGPFFYDEHAETQHTWAIPPLLSYTHDPAVDLEEIDFVYPILTYDRYGKQSRWQLFQLLSFANGPSQNEPKRNRFTLFPFYFQQRSSDPSENYTAILPFYGHLKNRLFRDEVFFIMFPLYAQTRRGEVITDNYLVPIFDVRHGPGLHGWQVWPLYGQEHKDVTTHTNMFDEPESIPGHDKRFVLWPIFFNEHSGLGTTNPVWDQGVLPLYSFERSAQRDSTTVIWPFFSHVTDREQKYKEWDAPWPFIVFARGEGKHTTRVWPLFSQARSPTLEDDFYLWPLYKVDSIHSAPLERRRRRILFFVYSDTLEKSTDTGLSRRRTDLWPLFTRRRELNGNTRLQVLALLEVWTLGSHKIDRDYSPVWSIWRSEHNAKTQARSQSLLWNLYRRDAGPEQSKVSALFGLFQYQRGPGGKNLRVFYIPFGKGERKSAQAAADTKATFADLPAGR
jgi:hypothetical protein